jgi:spore coat polysaccharide biosynthesis protein SpsF
MINNKKIICVIECRMSSSRLPGKVMLKFGNQTIIEFMVERIKKSKLIDDVVIATTVNPNDDAIEKLCTDKGINFFRGSEDNVAQRVLDTLIHFNADLACSITGDCPFVYPPDIDKLIGIQQKFDYDYVSNDVINRSYPDGLDIQIYKSRALAEVIPLITDQKHLTHSAWNIPTYGSNIFKIFHKRATGAYRWPELGLTLDEKKDYDFLCKIYEKFYANNNSNDVYSIYKIISFLRQHKKFISNMEVKRKIPGTDKFQGEG